MDQTALSEFKIWKALDEALLAKRYTGERRESLYPSEASVVVVDPTTKYAKVQGGCMRKSWYRILRFPQSNPATAKTHYIFMMGKVIEDMIAELCKLAGIYDNRSVKFWDKSSGVSGEIDVIVKLPVRENKYIFAEVKSSWGGNIVKGYEAGKAKAQFDHFEGRGQKRKFVKGKPKTEHLLQLLIYLYTHRDDKELIGGKLLYFLRDNTNRTEFDVTIQMERNGKHRAVVDGEVVKSFYVEDIYERYRSLAEKVNEDILRLRSGISRDDLVPPERDYSLKFDATTAKAEFEAGYITESQYKKYQEGKKILSDWNCNYCNYKDLCYSIREEKTNQEEEEEEDIVDG